MTSDKIPSLNKFYSDMNKHPRAEYKRISPKIILELDSMPNGWQITVWEAVKQGGSYVIPDGDNSFEWDAVGRRSFEGYDEGKEAFRELTSRRDVQTFCEKNPYNGPRTPYHEQDN